MKIYSFLVFLKNKHIDTVFYGESFFKGFKNLKEVKESIKKSLINHDGYNPNIEVL